MDVHNCLVIDYYVVYAQLLHSTILWSMHCIASFYETGQDTAYVQIVSAEPIAHPFPLFPYLYVGTRRGFSGRRTILSGTARVDLVSFHAVHISLQQLFMLLVFLLTCRYTCLYVETRRWLLFIYLVVSICCPDDVSSVQCMLYFSFLQTYIMWRQPGLWVCVYLYSLVELFPYILLSGLFPVDRG